MGSIKLLENTVQTYAWGSHTAIADFLGKPSPSPDPWAELWMGAHPKASSRIQDKGRRVSLIDFIAQDPFSMLGESAAKKFKGQLPFLFKVLAAETPLSMQAHPDRTQAEEGFEREDRAGIPMDAPDRNYKDSNHKPECLCALTPFSALCGFRPIHDILEFFSKVLPSGFEDVARTLENNLSPSGLKVFFLNLLALSAERRKETVACAVSRAKKLAGQSAAYEWMVRLHQAYPGDIGVLAPAFLNLVVLEPGQALFLPAATLHVYLQGTGLEVMANSDNVLRGGLTPKHVDAAELSRILAFEERVPQILFPDVVSDCEKVYVTPALEFGLSVISVSGTQPCHLINRDSAGILLCIQGKATLREEKGGAETALARGDSVFVPACTGPYGITGEALLYRAFVPS